MTALIGDAGGDRVVRSACDSVDGGVQSSKVQIETKWQIFFNRFKRVKNMQSEKSIDPSTPRAHRLVAFTFLLAVIRSPMRRTAHHRRRTDQWNEMTVWCIDIDLSINKRSAEFMPAQWGHTHCHLTNCIYASFAWSSTTHILFRNFALVYISTDWSSGMANHLTLLFSHLTKRNGHWRRTSHRNVTRE